MMRIKLIEPKFRGEWSEQDERDMRAFWFARLTLPAVAALTPPDVEVVITDENVDEIDFDDPVDLVGLTAMTMHAPAAYRIAAEFRRRGVSVVMGGIHASLLPEEAKGHVDSVVIGEAEEVWPKVVADTMDGRLQPFYQGNGHPSLAGLPKPRMDLLKAEAYESVACIQTTRGCPFHCEYCSVSKFFGRTYRTRPVEDVIEEVRSCGERFVAFVDDNIGGDPRYARALFEGLKPLGIKWGSQASLTLAQDRELLRLAMNSGCYSLFIGIESLDQENLIDVHKRSNQVRQYETALKTLRDHGITVVGSFILGLDHDDEAVFERTLEFCVRNHVDIPVFFVLTPVPGTSIYSRLEQEGRILTRDWEKYDGMHVVFQPRLMKPETLQQGFQWICQEAYSWGSIAKRVLMHPNSRLISHLGLNLAFRRIAYRVPKGVLSPLARLLKMLNDAVPVKDASHLLPTLPEEAVERGRAWVRETYDVLKIKATYDETIKTVVLHLEGAMDLRSAKTLISKLQRALENVPRIVVDFEKVHHLSPRAAGLLLTDHLEKIQAWRDQIRLVNLNERVQGMLEGMTAIMEQEQIVEKGR